MISNPSLAAIHGYLSGDGCVIQNPKNSKYKYFRVDFRNTELVLLKHFRDCFFDFFNVEPFISKNNDRCTISRKEYYTFFNEHFGSFYSYEWSMPELSEDLSCVWLRAFFDCEAWVVNIPGKNRAIGLDCVNLNGLKQIVDSLKKLGIATSEIKKKRKRNIYSIHIWGKENLLLYEKKISFLHPNKKKLLSEAILSYDLWKWDLSTEAKIREIIREKTRFGKNRVLIFSRKENLENLKKILLKKFDITSSVITNKNGMGTIYYSLNIYGKRHIEIMRNICFEK